MQPGVHSLNTNNRESYEKISYRRRLRLVLDDGHSLCSVDDVQHIDIYDSANSCYTATGHTEHD
jgi:hypothetical protein